MGTFPRRPALGLAVLLWTLLPGLAPAQVLDLQPGVLVPLGDPSAPFGTGVQIETGTRFPWEGTPVSLTATLGAGGIPAQPRGSILFLSVLPGIAVSWAWDPVWTLDAEARAGAALAARATFALGEIDPVVEAGLSLRAAVGPGLTFGAGATWTAFPGLFQGLGVWVGVTQAGGAP
jgi:hypothetical protein